jgi:hypothetical protein
MIAFSNKMCWDYEMPFLISDSNWTMHHSRRGLLIAAVYSFVQHRSLEQMCPDTSPQRKIYAHSVIFIATSTMNPYQANPDRIPPTDLYADVPLYGRYFPKPDDFHVDLQHINSETPDAIQYWTLVVTLCSEENRIYPADEGCRDVFALGEIIVKSSHLHDELEKDYSYADANEVRAIGVAKGVFEDIRIPDIYFSGKVFLLLFLFQLLYVFICANDTSDQWSQCACSRETARRYYGRRMALSLANPKGIFQGANPRCPPKAT